MLKSQENSLGQTETIVGQSVKLKGNLKSEGDVKILGSLNGEIKTKGNVLVEKDAVVEGKINGLNVVVSGNVTGNVEASEQLEISESGRIFGDISCHILAVKPGGIFSGKSTMETETLSEQKPEEEMEVEPEYEEIASEK